MSTQSPTPPTPKGPRNARRNPKRNTTPYTPKAALLSTPPSSPPGTMSPGGMATDTSNAAKSSKKKNIRSGKKPRDNHHHHHHHSGHRHTSSQPNNVTTPQFKDSPHYAGPTFHASPAPSALPIPSFLSKSVPSSDLEPAVELESDHLETEPELDTTPSKPRSRPPVNGEKQSTPLDFLFKAAVEARNSKAQHSPEADPKIRSPQTDSKAMSQRNHNGLGNGIFPFEMEANEARNLQIGPSFAPSYKDRMDALRSNSSPSQPATDDLSPEQRRAKAEALKSLLLNPRPQKPPSASHLAHGQASNVTGQPSAHPKVPHFATPLRTTSGPPGTITYGLTQEQVHPMTGAGSRPTSAPKQANGHPQSRTQHSALRQELSSSSPGDVGGIQEERFPSPSASSRQSSFLYQHIPQPRYSTSPRPQPVAAHTVPARPPPQSVDTKRLEDDLRRVLKIDSIPSSGIQSSYV